MYLVCHPPTVTQPIDPTCHSPRRRHRIDGGVVVVVVVVACCPCCCGGRAPTMPLCCPCSWSWCPLPLWLWLSRCPCCCGGGVGSPAVIAIMVVVGGWGGVVPPVPMLLVSCPSLSLPRGGGGFSKGCKRKKENEWALT